MATAARLGSRVDAGLLAGCVVLSLIAVALPGRRSRADRRRAAPHDRRAARRTAARRRTLARRLGRERAAPARSRLDRDARHQGAGARRSRTINCARSSGSGSRLEWGFVPAEALHGTAPSEDVVTHADARRPEAARGCSATARSSRRKVSSGRSTDRRPDDEHRDPLHES